MTVTRLGAMLILAATCGLFQPVSADLTLSVVSSSSVVSANASSVQVASLQRGQRVSAAAKNLSSSRKLSASYSSGFVTTQDGRKSESGVLVPSGVFVTSAGVSIGSPVGAASQPITVSVERVDPATVKPLPSNYKLIGSMYRISSPNRVLAQSKLFTIGLPIPVILPTEKGYLISVSLINDATIYSDVEPTYDFIWASSPFDEDKNTNNSLFTVSDGVFLPEGTVYALAWQSSEAPETR